MRCLVAARLSRLRDESTGIERQDEEARRWVDQGGHELVTITADTDVSGDTDPWSRPALGPWLTEPARVAQYDAIVASHADRLARSTVHFMRLLHWADDNGKRIVTTGEAGIDFGTPMGKLLGYIISWLGEQELEAIKRRWRSTHRWMHDHGYLVGKPPFGYMITEHPDDPERKTLTPDPALAPYVEELVTRALRGEGYAALARWLDSEGIPAPSSEKWWGRTVKGILTNPMLYGRRVSNGRTVLRVDPIIPYERWVRLQEVVTPRRGPGNTGPNPGLLSGFAYCAKCGRRLNIKRNLHRGREYRYLRCSDGRSWTCHNSIREDALLDHLERFIAYYGDREVVERVTIPGGENTHALEVLGQDMTELTQRYAAGDVSDEEYDRRFAALRAERARLLELPREPDRVETRPTGETVAERWASMDLDGKRDYLRRAGVKLHAVKDAGGNVLVDFEAEHPETLTSTGG